MDSSPTAEEALTIVVHFGLEQVSLSHSADDTVLNLYERLSSSFGKSQPLILRDKSGSVVFTSENAQEHTARKLKEIGTELFLEVTLMTPEEIEREIAREEQEEIEQLAAIQLAQDLDCQEQNKENEQLSESGELAHFFGPLNKPIVLTARNTVGLLRYRGLANQGATCYLNSLIQALYMTPELRSAVFQFDFQKRFEISLPKRYARILRARETNEKMVDAADFDDSLVELLTPLLEEIKDVKDGEKVEDVKSVKNDEVKEEKKDEIKEEKNEDVKGEKSDEVKEEKKDEVKEEEKDEVKEEKKDEVKEEEKDEINEEKNEDVKGGKSDEVKDEKNEEAKKKVPLRKFKIVKTLPTPYPEVLLKYYSFYEDSSITRQLQLLFLQLQFSQMNAISTTKLTKSFGWDPNQSFRQQDAQEFMRILFDSLDTSFSSFPSLAKVIPDLYEGSEKGYVTCSTCGSESSRLETFLDLAVSVRNFGETETSKSVFESIAKYVAPEQLDGDNSYRCERCDKLCPAQKGSSITKFPYIFTLQLKRFDFDVETFERVKLNNSVKFPSYIDLNEFLEGNEAKVVDKYIANKNTTRLPFVIYNPDEMKDLQSEILTFESPKPSNDEKTNYYELFAVLIHSGSAFGGHYYSYIKNLENSHWLTFNDGNVSECSISDLRSSYGFKEEKIQTKGRKEPTNRWRSNAGSNYYILFYRKIDSKNSRFPKLAELSPNLKFKLCGYNEEQRKEEISQSVLSGLFEFVVHFDGKDETFEYSETLDFETVLKNVCKKFGLTITDNPSEFNSEANIFPRDRIRVREYDSVKMKPLQPLNVKPNTRLKDIEMSSLDPYLYIEVNRKTECFSEWEPEKVSINLLVRKKNDSLAMLEKAKARKLSLNKKKKDGNEKEKNKPTDPDDSDLNMLPFSINKDDIQSTKFLSMYSGSEMEEMFDENKLLKISILVNDGSVKIFDLKKQIAEALKDEQFDIDHMIIFEENTYPNFFPPAFVTEYIHSAGGSDPVFLENKLIEVGKSRLYVEYSENPKEMPKLSDSYFKQRFLYLKNSISILLYVPIDLILDTKLKGFLSEKDLISFEKKLENLKTCEGAIIDSNYTEFPLTILKNFSFYELKQTLSDFLGLSFNEFRIFKTEHSSKKRVYLNPKAKYSLFAHSSIYISKETENVLKEYEREMLVFVFKLGNENDPTDKFVLNLTINMMENIPLAEIKKDFVTILQARGILSEEQNENFIRFKEFVFESTYPGNVINERKTLKDLDFNYKPINKIVIQVYDEPIHDFFVKPVECNEQIDEENDKRNGQKKKCFTKYFDKYLYVQHYLKGRKKSVVKEIPVSSNCNLKELREQITKYFDIEAQKKVIEENKQKRRNEKLKQKENEKKADLAEPVKPKVSFENDVAQIIHKEQEAATDLQESISKTKLNALDIEVRSSIPKTTNGEEDPFAAEKSKSGFKALAIESFDKAKPINGPKKTALRIERPQKENEEEANRIQILFSRNNCKLNECDPQLVAYRVKNNADRVKISKLSYDPYDRMYFYCLPGEHLMKYRSGAMQIGDDTIDIDVPKGFFDPVVSKGHAKEKGIVIKREED